MKNASLPASIVDALFAQVGGKLRDETLQLAGAPVLEQRDFVLLVLAVELAASRVLQ